MKLSVIIPVLNESAIIDQTIEGLRSLAEEVTLEIIVADGDPDGGTLKAIPDSDIKADIKKITAPRGRGRQLNAGAAAATGDILLFLHADTRLPDKSGKHIINTCADPAVAAGAFDLGIDSPRKVFRAVEKAASWRSRVTLIPYGDQAVFVKAPVFKEIGGFRPIPIMEDIDFARRLKRGGHRLRFIPCRVQTSARRWETEGVLYATLRNYSLALLFYFGVSPYWLKKFYH